MSEVLDFDVIRDSESNWAWPPDMKKELLAGDVYYAKVGITNVSYRAIFKPTDKTVESVTGKSKTSTVVWMLRGWGWWKWWQRRHGPREQLVPLSKLLIRKAAKRDFLNRLMGRPKARILQSCARSITFVIAVLRTRMTSPGRSLAPGNSKAETVMPRKARTASTEKMEALSYFLDKGRPGCTRMC